MNITREFYKKVVAGARPEPEHIDDIIAAAKDLESLQKHMGWRRIEKFIETQKQGSKQYLDRETQTINLFSLPWLFNTFLKYLGVMFENRAYNRIETYMKVTIRNGNKYAEKRAKEEIKRGQHEDNN